NGAHFRAEIQGATFNAVVDQLDPKGIAGQNQPLLASIPNGKAEHSIQAVQNFFAPLFVAVNDDFGVAVGAKGVTVALQLLFEFREVVNLPIEDDPDRFFLVRHRLMPAGQINDRKPAKSETQRSGDEIALVIRTAVSDGFGHGLDVRASNRL